MAAEDERGYVLYADFQFVGDESAETGGIEHSGHADDALAWKPAELVGSLRHRIQRIRNNDQDAIWRIIHHFSDHSLHDAVIGVKQIVTAHPWLARDAGGDDHDVGVRRVFVVVGAGNVRVPLLDWHGLEQVESFPLRNALDDINEYNIGEFF